jgi:luciferase family oxidoreductase group 1
MLPHYSPLKVAESFSLLAGLYPDRIDLALGRAPGSDQLTMFALQRDRRQAAPDDFPQQLAELLAYFEDDLPADHPFRHLARTLPGRPELPQPWLLGSSEQSALWAGELGLPYAFADFINSNGATIAQTYRERFSPVRELKAPRVTVATWALCAPTDEEAQHLATSSQMAFKMLRRGSLIPVPSPEKAASWLASDAAGPRGASSGRRTIIGSPETVRAGIEEAATEYGADEVIVVTITYDHEARRRSYELIAEAFGLESRALAVTTATAPAI